MYDYLDLFNMYEREKEERAKEYPICAYCGERVIQERGLMLPDTGEYMCDSCIEINMKWLID